jgi:hypothetical protein
MSRGNRGLTESLKLTGLQFGRTLLGENSYRGSVVKVLDGPAA